MMITDMMKRPKKEEDEHGHDDDGQKEDVTMITDMKDMLMVNMIHTFG